MRIRNTLGKVSIFHAVLGSNHFSIPKDSSLGGCTGLGWFNDRRKEDEIHYVCGWPAGALRIRREFHGGFGAVKSGVRTMSGNAVYFRKLHELPHI